MYVLELIWVKKKKRTSTKKLHKETAISAGKQTEDEDECENIDDGNEE